MTDLLRSFPEDFDALVQSYPERIAFIVDTELNPVSITYRELHILVGRCLKLFKVQKLEPGDVILGLMPNSLETVVVFLAAIKGGYGYAPLPCTATKQEIERWMALVAPSICVTTPLVSGAAKEAIAGSARRALLIDTDARFSWLPDDVVDGPLHIDSKIYLATSGTTGSPKAIVIDGNRLWSSGCAFAQFNGLAHGTMTFWNYLPMSYLGGLFNLALLPMTVAATVVIDEPFSGKTFLSFWHTVRRYRINAVWFVPSIVRGLLKMAERYERDELKNWSKQLDVCFLGTAPIDLQTKRTFEEKFEVQLLENFALSETTFFSAETPDVIRRREEGSVGEVLPYADVKVCEIERDEEGTWSLEVLVKSPFLFLGYLQDDGSISAETDTDGFFATGDLGRFNDSEQLVISGRKRDIIKKGGYFVSLRELENVALQHPKVSDAAAVMVPHEFYGEASVLFAALKQNEAEHEAIQDISQFIHSRLVSYKWPEKVVIRDEFPRTPSGKIRKHLLSMET